MPRRSNSHATEPDAAQVAVVLVEDVAHVGRGAVAVVGQRLDDQRNAARPVALVDDRLVRVAVAFAPAPRAIARSMLSFGIEYERAFSIAFWSARLAVGSPPPSRAATMIARASFENSLPRLSSAAPFLCLIDDHLLCPDTVRFVATGGSRPPSWERRRATSSTSGHARGSPCESQNAVAVLDAPDVGGLVVFACERLERVLRDPGWKGRKQGAGRQRAPGIRPHRFADGEAGPKPQDRRAVDDEA